MKRTLSILFVLAVVLSFSLLAIPVAAAATPTIDHGTFGGAPYARDDASAVAAYKAEAASIAAGGYVSDTDYYTMEATLISFDGHVTYATDRGGCIYIQTVITGLETGDIVEVDNNYFYDDGSGYYSYWNQAPYWIEIGSYAHTSGNTINTWLIYGEPASGGEYTLVIGSGEYNLALNTDDLTTVIGDSFKLTRDVKVYRGETLSNPTTSWRGYTSSTSEDTSGWGAPIATDSLDTGDLSYVGVQDTYVDDDWVGSDNGDVVGGHIFGQDAFDTVQKGIDGAADGGTVHVAAGTYAEGTTLTPGKDLTIVGAGRDLVTWICPSDDECIHGDMTGYTGGMSYEISGFTFNCRSQAATTHGTGIEITHASSGPLSLSIHDNRFIEDRASGDDTHWATSMWLCHNRYATRDGSGNPAVRVFNNIDETWGGMTMSNSQAYDIYNNTFDGCSDAIYNGHGCPDAAGQTFGDHHIYGNTFKNASDALHPGALTPAIDWQYYGAGGGTHLPSVIEDNSFENNDTAIRCVMETSMTYPANIVRNNCFTNNGMALRVDGTYASTVNAEDNWWGDDSGPTHSSNPSGTGDPVTDNVDFDPWTGKTTSVPTTTGTGTASFASSSGGVANLTAVPTPPSPPVTLPHGMFNFTICCLNPGDTVTLTVTLPTAVPVGTRWYKYIGGSWYSLPIGGDGTSIITVTLTDGAFPDDEDTIPGQITDQGGPGGGGAAVGWETYPVSKARVLLPWIALLAVIVAGASLLVVRRRRAQS